MKIKVFFTEIFLLSGLSLLFNILKIRICPFYYFFKIPCPGCGLTRSFIELLKGNLCESLKYNILGLIIFIVCMIYLLLLIIKKDGLFELFVKKYKTIFIIFSIVLLLLVEIININNEILY